MSQGRAFVQKASELGNEKFVLLACLTGAPPQGYRETSEILQTIGTPEQLLRKIKVQASQAESLGFILEAKPIPADPKTFPRMLEEIEDQLRSQNWDAFMVGFGIRGTPQYTEFFEQLVNSAVQIKPQIRLLFNAKPDDLCETISRSFPARVIAAGSK